MRYFVGGKEMRLSLALLPLLLLLADRAEGKAGKGNKSSSSGLLPEGHPLLPPPACASAVRRHRGHQSPSEPLLRPRAR